MLLHINGEPHELPDGLTVAALVGHLGMKADRVAVELNLAIVPRANWDATILNNGDKLEIVHFVGGGSGPAASVPESQSQGAQASRYIGSSSFSLPCIRLSPILAVWCFLALCSVLTFLIPALQ